jgi:protein-S-isoprenylcysteine O-methyltransferase Ste14
MRTCQAGRVHHIRDGRAGADESAPSSLGRVLALAREHPAATDRVLTAVLAAASLAGLWLVTWSNPSHYRSPDIGGILLTLAAVVPLAWRRQHPALVLVISGLALLAYDAAGYRSGLVWLAPFWAVYSYAVHRRRRNAYWPLAVWVAVILADLALPQYNTVQTAVVFLGVTALVWVRGDAVRSGVIEARQEREARARQAVADERARIARELHDVVSQALGVIVMQAGGAGSVPSLSETDAKAAFGGGWAPVAAGLAVLAAGVALRTWAILTLGRLFKFVVVIQEGHRVVASGPYRLLRHPSYTGALVAFLGVGIVLDNWLSVLTLVLIPLLAILVRIHVEEGALSNALGREYATYASRTRRLVPGLW